MTLDFPVEFGLQKQHLAEKADLPPAAKYDETYYHRNYTAVRCFPLDGTHQTKSASESAVEQAQLHVQHLASLESAKVIERQRAQERFSAALHSVTMERVSLPAATGVEGDI
jgi:hypothetical protein